MSNDAILGPVGLLRRRLGPSFAALKGVFANPNLRRLQLAYAGSSMGNFAYGVAIAVYAYQHGGATAVGVVTAIRQVIAAGIAPFAASLADRYPRERVMLGSDLGRLVSVGATAVLVTTHSASLIVYVVATITTILGTIFRPAESALMPLLARSPEELTAANVSSSTFDSLGVFVGPSIAAFLLAISGPAAALTFNAITFAWSAYFIARVHTPPGAAPREGSDTPAAVACRRLQGDRRRAAPSAPDRPVRRACFVAGALGVFVVVIALKLLGLGTAGVGLLQAACGVGALAGAAVALSLVARARIAADFAIGLLLWGLPLLLVGAAPTAIVAALALGIVGVGNTLVDISAMTLLQRATPPDVAGRVFGCLESVIVGSIALGALATPALIGLLGVRGALFAIGGLLPVLSILRWRSLGAIDLGAGVSSERVQALGGFRSSHRCRSRRSSASPPSSPMSHLRRRNVVRSGRRRRPVLRLACGLAGDRVAGRDEARGGARVRRRDRAAPRHPAHRVGARPYGCIAVGARARRLPRRGQRPLAQPGVCRRARRDRLGAVTAV